MSIARPPRRTNFARYSPPIGVAPTARPGPQPVPQGAPAPAPIQPPPPTPGPASEPQGPPQRTPRGTPWRGPKQARPTHGRCSLRLKINGQSYGVRPVACDSAAALKCFELRKADATRYHVSQHDHGAECSCPDFVFVREGRDPRGCKHVAALTALGLLALPITIPAPGPVADDIWEAP